jgi:two-component system sensor histidine kinase ChiS
LTPIPGFKSLYLALPSYWLGLLLGLCCFAAAAEPDYHVRFESLKTRDGVTLGYIDAILQDSRGYIWLGGENGLVRYDGYEFRVYRNQPDAPDSLSNNTVWALVEDGGGDLWIATEGGVNRYHRDRDNFSSFQHNPGDIASLTHNTVRALHITRSGNILVGTFGGGAGLLDPDSGHFTSLTGPGTSTSSQNVWAVLEDLSGKLWFGSEGGGAWSYDPVTRGFNHYHSRAGQTQHIASDTVRAISQDRSGDIWLGTDAGVYLLNAGLVSDHWQHVPSQNASLGSNVVWDVFEDRHGDIWVATDGGGLNRLRRNSPLVRRFVHNSRDPLSLSSNVVRQVMEDRSGDLWTANFPSGANVFHRAAQWVAHVRHNPDSSEGLNHPSVLAFLEGGDGSLWIGTDGGGLNHLRPDGSYAYLGKQTDGGGLSTNAVLALAQDKQGDIWIGTWGGGVSRYTPASGRIHHYPAQPDNPSALSHPNVWAIVVDQYDNVWFGTEGGGLNRYNRANDSFERFPYGKADTRHTVGGIVWGLHEDHKGLLWIGTNAGLSRFDPASGTFRHWQHADREPLGLSNNTVLAILEDRQHQIWVGTRAGLNRLHANGETFQTIRTRDGLANDSISSILQDGDGYLWLGTNDGLAQLDPASYRLRNYHQTDWARGKFNYGAALKLHNGELLFGGIQGFIRFLPQNLQVNNFKPPVALTDFQIFNQRPPIGTLPRSLDTIEHIVLDHRQSVFSFTFAALNFYGSESNRYAYKLDGFDLNWNEVGTARRATYTNLGAGEYVFRVKAANNDGVWNDQGLNLRLTITPAPWRTWWAYLLYTVAFGLLVRAYLQAQKSKIARERSLNERLLELDRMKDDFLANTSHELRTPLNGIIGLAESLLDGAAGDLSKQMQLNLRMIAGSGRRLAHLVNDILDFARLKNRKLQLQLAPLHLRPLVDTVLVMCRPLVGKKDLDLSNQVDEELPALLADENRLQQILYNLIGNAIKFTDAGSIVVSARRDQETIRVEVRDTGIGIASEHLDHLFTAFAQIEGHAQRQQSGAGLGLGLAVSKQLVELQGGEIGVESEPGRGTLFHFSLPYTDAAPAEGLMRNTLAEPDSLHERLPVIFAEGLTVSGVAHNNTAQQQANQHFRILLVDDEPVNRQVLCNQLSLQGYSLMEAAGGREALDLLQNQGPFDLVLLDIMMPQMNGYEVCTRIREMHSMNELPVIFLTAKNLIADLVDGFEVGANDFLTKPVARGELISRVRTHLQLLDVHRHLEEKVKERTHAVEEANRVLETLDGIVATINQEVILERLLDVLLREAARLFPAAEKVIYWSFNAASHQFEAVAGQGFRPSQLQGVRINKDLLLNRYCQAGQRLGEDLYLLRSASTSGLQVLPGVPAARAELALLVSFDDCLAGFLCLLNLSSQDAFSTVDTITLGRFHAHIKSALLRARLMETLKAQNEKLTDASLTDSLTGLRNRRYLLKYLDSDIALTLRSHRGQLQDQPPPPNSDLLFFILDLDHFKTVNDTHGHKAGDRVLVQIRQIMEGVFRQSDFLVRWGGEEFLMVARFSNRKAAPLMAERLRQAVNHHKFDLGNGQQTQHTCSIGFACFPYLLSDPLAFSWSQVVDIADLCLLAAKRSQRDCWVGLEAQSIHEAQITYQAIATRPQQLLNEQKLLLHSSLVADKSVRW